MTGQGADELRVRAFLRALRARPFGHQEPAMTDDRRPITPTRVIPAGADLPARAPQPGEAPPWRTPPPPPPAPPMEAPPPLWPPAPRTGPIEVRVILDLTPPPEPEPEPGLWERTWDYLWARLVTWQMLSAILAALLPWLGGQSPVGAWSHTVHDARTEAGIAAAYVIAGTALASAWALDRHTGRWTPRFLLVTASLGAFGVLHWYDPITLITGVHL